MDKISDDSKIVLVTGGTRSGKSGHAEFLAKESGKDITYIATSIPLGEEMEDRIKKHREARPSLWPTLEMYKDIAEVVEKEENDNTCYLLDCVTIMTTNLMFEDTDVDWDSVSRDYIDDIETKIKQEFIDLMKVVRDCNKDIIFVTNELGMGIVPANKLSRIFRDIAGSVNQLIAREADEVYFCVSGIPTKIK